MEHEFTKTIKKILKENFGFSGEQVFAVSELIQYLNIKTKSANKGSKSRGSFANLYAIYVLAEDYFLKKFHQSEKYSDYEGAVYTNIFKRQRELPFGQKLQNHALNHRLNEEFKRYFPTCDFIPVLRNPKTNRYWFNENLLKVKIQENVHNIAETVIQIIDAYVEAKRDSFEKFLQLCKEAQALTEGQVIEFIKQLLAPTVDARIFEIVSYSILKYYYSDRSIYWGYEVDQLQQENLKLFKTGRTNANDGGIDFVMKPLGRFFQVTETVDMNKYFLDIDKIEKYPITFVVKSSDSNIEIKSKIEAQARKQYSINAIVSRYMECIEEIINVAILIERFEEAVAKGYLNNILNEIIKQSRLEFNYEAEKENLEIELLDTSLEDE
ncbi:restriction endonuclease [Tychonema sp. LEGE 07199]|uniref:restriction endonuclease n=1 Tax=unclassified Tychonema TaxID=2642144 RepID=UPI001880FD0E|nr:MULTISPECIES: restriction endonuclease [unclassified Tychonema]MBE9121422.1 restriction endonuclease [Tychonema sp. LEGE 07199]MBE9134640.1 restriction endonuclease [Tychonema sp. LEGE 07196]